MVLDIRPLRDDWTNVEWLNAIRNSAGLEYQTRVPEATQANIADTVKSIFGYAPARNQFIDTLINRIGLTIFQNTIWTNPLARYKRGTLEYGETIQEIMAGFLEASVYDPDRDELEKEIFGAMKPEVQASYHTVNRRDRYKLTVKEPLLRNAFLTPNGLGEFITNLMTMPQNSDQYDEYLLMINLFRLFDENEAMFVQNVPDISDFNSGPAESKALLRRLKEFGSVFNFPSRMYNPAGLPVVARPEETILIMTATAAAAVDVEALAGAFNLNKTEFLSRQIIVPGNDIGIPGTEAILTTDKFFVVADQRIETTAIQNPAALHTNYWLHHWEVISGSRFAPMVLFNSQRESTNIAILSASVTSVSIDNVFDVDGVNVTTVERGRLYNVATSAVTVPENAPVDAVIYDVQDATSELTKISNNGVLYVGPDESANTLTIKITSVKDESKTDTQALNVVGDLLTLWPKPNVQTDADGDGLYEVVPENLVKVGDTVTIPEVKGVQYRKGGVNVNNGTEHTITESTTFDAVARPNNEIKSGSTTSWTFAP